MKVIFLDIDGVLNCSTLNDECGLITGIDSDVDKAVEILGE